MATPADIIRNLEARVKELKKQVEELTATYEEYKRLAAEREIPPDTTPSGEPSTIEAPEIIPGIKPPRIPLLMAELAKIPLLPGWVIRDADGTIIAGEEPDTIEFQEIIQGIKPPAIPQLIPGLEKLPLLPGWTIRDPGGEIVVQGEPLPTVGGETSPEPEFGTLTPEYIVLPETVDQVIIETESDTEDALTPEYIVLPETVDQVIIETESDTEDALTPEILSDEPLEIDVEDMEI